MNEHEKNYWKRVYLYFGNDMQSWSEDDVTKFDREYFDNNNISPASNYPQYFDTDDDTGEWKFTDKFLKEVMTW